jgi:hypothetical protein
MRAQVLLPDGCIRIEPGCHAMRYVHVRNLGLDADRFTFEVVGAAASWTTLDPPTLALGPEATGQVAVHFRPPRAAHVRAGLMPFGVLTTSSLGDAGSVVEQLLEVGPFTDTALELVPCAIRRRSATFRLLVANRGNVTVRTSLRGRDPEDALRVDCVPAKLTVFPGGVAQSHIRVRPTRLHWRGRPRTLPFDVVASSEDVTALPLFVEGELSAYPILPA